MQNGGIFGKASNWLYDGTPWQVSGRSAPPASRSHDNALSVALKNKIPRKLYQYRFELKCTTFQCEKCNPKLDYHLCQSCCCCCYCFCGMFWQRFENTINDVKLCYKPWSSSHICRHISRYLVLFFLMSL